MPRAVLDQLRDDFELYGLMVLLVDLAAYQERPGRNGEVLKPGELYAGKRRLAKLTNRAASWCERGTARLQNRALIEPRPSRVEKIISICNWGTYRPPSRRRRARTGPDSSRDRAATEPDSSQDRALSTNNQSTNNQLPPPGDWGEGEREEIETRLIRAGVAKVATAIDQARAGGVTADHVLDLIEFWTRYRNGWDDPGAKLYFRVCNARRGVSVEEGWQEFRPGYIAGPQGAMSSECRSLIRELDSDSELAAILGESHRFPPDVWRSCHREASETAPAGLPPARVNLLAARLYRERRTNGHVTNGSRA